MTVLSEIQARAWCEERGRILTKNGRPVLPSNAEQFPIPSDAGQRVAMVARDLSTFSSDSEILVWFTKWGIWPSAERQHIFDRLRASYGETRSLIDSPGHLFSRREFEDMVSFVTLGVLFLWDVFVVGTRLLHYSHDEIGNRVL
jgi:hypothetical protein